METVKENLGELKKIIDWYGEHIDWLKTIKDYLELKYDIFSKLRDTVDVALEVWFDWTIEDLTSEVFLKLDKAMWKDYIEDKGVLAKWMLILEWDKEALQNEIEFIKNFDKILND